MDLLKDTGYVLDDVLAVMLAETNTEAFTGDTARIHETFYELSQEFPLLKPLMNFTNLYAYPYSRQLDEGLVRLETSRLIGMENPDYNRYVIKSATINLAKNHLAGIFKEDELQQIRKMAKLFKETCGVEP